MREFLFFSSPDTVLQSRCGSLYVRDGNGIETLYPPRAHGLRTIILTGYGASITSEAIRWAGREGVALSLMERNGEGVAALTNSPEANGRRRALHMREQQWRAFLDLRKRLAVAGKIVRAKLQTLGLHPASGRCARREFREELADARKLEDILVCEARAGAVHWMRWRGFPLKFEPDRPAAKREQRDGTVRSGASRGLGGVRVRGKARVVRLGPPLAREVAALALRVATMPQCGKAVKRIAAWF